MIKTAKVLSVSPPSDGGHVPKIVTQEFAFGIFPIDLHCVYDDTGFDVKVGQWIYIDTYFKRVAGVVK